MTADQSPGRFITAPLCDDCWTIGREHPPMRIEPPMLRRTEQCAMCGDPTTSGIYLRVRASDVFYIPEDER